MEKVKQDPVEQKVHLFHPVSGTGIEINITQGEIINEMNKLGLTIGGRGKKSANQKQVALGVLSIAKEKYGRGNWKHFQKSNEEN